MIVEALSPVASAARDGLSQTPKTLPPWLFYDERGSHLFEQITILPEYYLTRTERALLEQNAGDILTRMEGPVTIAELGAGTATKTGILLAAAASRQQDVLYQPIDVSPTALDEAAANIEDHVPGVTVRSQVANYITEPILIERPAGQRVLALYIGSSIGNFSPEEAGTILRNLRAQLQPGDGLLLGTDLAPGAGSAATKTVASLISAYDDAQGITAAFNLNMLRRLNRELGTDFMLDRFTHQAVWNAAESRIEMHLVSVDAHTVSLDGAPIRFTAGETIHTENSYKFTPSRIADMLTPTGFGVDETYIDAEEKFAVTLAKAV